jgi:hypothetical protein
VLRVCLVELAVLAEKTTDRLAGGALNGRPVSLLVAGRAGVRAVVAFSAAVGTLAGSRQDSLDVQHSEEGASDPGRLDASPATDTEVVERDGTVL